MIAADALPLETKLTGGVAERRRSHGADPVMACVAQRQAASPTIREAWESSRLSRELVAGAAATEIKMAD